jgi:hypothetical protein
MGGTGVNLTETEVTERSSQKVGSGRVVLEKVHCYQGSLSTPRYEVNNVGLSTNMSGTQGSSKL